MDSLLTYFLPEEKNVNLNKWSHYWLTLIRELNIFLKMVTDTLGERGGKEG